MDAPEDQSDAIRERLVDLVDYVEHMVRLGEKPVFALSEYRQLADHERVLKGRIGIEHDQSDEDGPIWLSIERLKRINPPDIPEEAQPWITVNPGPHAGRPLWRRCVHTAGSSSAPYAKCRFLESWQRHLPFIFR